MNILKQIIDNKGYKLSHVASELSLTREGFYKKLRGDTEFKASEIAKLVELLKLTSKETKDIFFK
ncbi:toxin-antitoxin system, antitoxin component, Xre family protein [Veillonella sp. T14073-2]|uniref:toxin-antitoxin system, antitoxin component, Xre family protein n=1 Tax=Veillonella sp. T14073-2 TaxID=1911680 RepID=UPI000CF4EB68|nr:toxin-antitoxin system, antitoxin component, Xre family protein [Veillonella sp. T14073-2]PQL22491.1 toxin-antitoxin system, antitoxin component, Xre family protein [Veillonella sp. T14073-2]